MFNVHTMYRITYLHPVRGYAGLSMLTSENDITAETARVEALGCVVTEVLRPIGAKLPPRHS